MTNIADKVIKAFNDTIKRSYVSSHSSKIYAKSHLFVSDNVFLILIEFNIIEYNESVRRYYLSGSNKTITVSRTYLPDDRIMFNTIIQPLLTDDEYDIKYIIE